MRGCRGGCGGMSRDVWSNKGWYQHSEFRTNRASHMNLARARRPSWPSPRSPRGVQLSYCLHLSAQLSLTSICTCPLRTLISWLQLSAHKLLSFFPPPYSVPVIPHPFMALDRAADWSAGRYRIVSECYDENGRKTGEHAPPLEEQIAVLRSAWRIEDGPPGFIMGPTWDCSVCCKTFGPFRQLIPWFKKTPCWFNTHQSSTVNWNRFGVTCHGKRSRLDTNLTPITHLWAN